MNRLEPKTIRTQRRSRRAHHGHMVTASSLGRGQQGTALVTVLLLTTIILALGAFGTRSAIIELRIASNELLSKKALDTAEAGLYHAFNLMQTGTTGRLVGQTFTTELGNGGTSGAVQSLGTL